jgi:hypothetical protein
MGQYYKIIIKEEGSKTTKTYDRSINGEYTLAKLTEHSYYLNDMVNAISEKLYYTPSQIAWVGDYADSVNYELYKLAWENEKDEGLFTTNFTLNGRFLVNHTKKQILDCWDYVRNCMRENKETWVYHPLPLLVAVGNGLGGGDYGREGNDYDKVGTWAWDVIEIVEWEDAQKNIKEKGYTVITCRFDY